MKRTSLALRVRLVRSCKIISVTRHPTNFQNELATYSWVSIITRVVPIYRNLIQRRLYTYMHTRFEIHERVTYWYTVSYKRDIQRDSPVNSWRRYEAFERHQRRTLQLARR